jgi:hypothetical protein
VDDQRLKEKPMRSLKPTIWVLAAFLLVGAVVRADPPADAVLDDQALAAKIDTLLAARWTAKNAKAAPGADDAEFLRRVYLDLVGRIPPASTVREFLDDKAPDKRRKLVEDLLESPLYVQHFATTWRAVILPPTNNNQFQFANPGFRLWIEQQVRDNVPYDKMAREVLTVPVVGLGQPGVVRGVPNTAGPSPAAYYDANERKPENLAEHTSKVFLGVRLGCAQCHHHPFASWKKHQFWEFAAFFANVQPLQRVGGGRLPQPMPDVGFKRTIGIPNTDKVVEGRFLDKTAPKWQDKVDSRVTLADWVTSADNPFFARTGANRMWGHFFGIGLIDPVDDEPTDENPISHPELLELLTKQFVAHKFDVKYLIKAITATEAYQRSSAQTHASQSDSRLFARMALRGLTPEQLFDSLAQATGYNERVPDTGTRVSVVGRGASPRAEFLAKFASQERRTETETSILQALSLMNGKFISDATSVERSKTLAAVADAPFLNTTQRVEALFLAALSRRPRPEESDRLVVYVNGGGPRSDASAALTDVFWALLNSSEFILNH